MLLPGLPPGRLPRDPSDEQLPQRQRQADLGLLFRRTLLPVHRVYLGHELQVRALQVLGGMEYPADLLATGAAHMPVALLLLLAMAGFAQLFSP
jgi:hypothetical protein